MYILFTETRLDIITIFQFAFQISVYIYLCIILYGLILVNGLVQMSPFINQVVTIVVESKTTTNKAIACDLMKYGHIPAP